MTATILTSILFLEIWEGLVTQLPSMTYLIGHDQWIYTQYINVMRHEARTYSITRTRVYMLGYSSNMSIKGDICRWGKSSDMMLDGDTW